MIQYKDIAALFHSHSLVDCVHPLVARSEESGRSSCVISLFYKLCGVKHEQYNSVSIRTEPSLHAKGIELKFAFLLFFLVRLVVIQDAPLHFINVLLSLFHFRSLSISLTRCSFNEKLSVFTLRVREL